MFGTDDDEDDMDHQRPGQFDGGQPRPDPGGQQHVDEEERRRRERARREADTGPIPTQRPRRPRS
jgi:hypothetical protein